MFSNQFCCICFSKVEYRNPKACFTKYLKLNRALDKRGVFDDNFSYFSWKSYVVTPHLNRLVEMVQIRGHNKWFYAE